VYTAGSSSGPGPLLGKPFEMGIATDQELHDDGRSDVRHDPETEKREFKQPAPVK
jgi:hypothetical protein